MERHDWNLLYERQPLSLDAILLAVALALHTPMLLIHMKAPPKSAKKPFARLVNIDFVEQEIRERKAKAVVLPPKIPETAKQLQEVVKKVEEQVKQQVFKRSLPPPPPPKSKLQDDLIKGPEISKLQENLLKDKLAQEQKKLQGKTGFQGSDIKLGGASEARDIKLGGGGAALQAVPARLSGVPGAGGGTLKGKSGFQVSQDAMPMSIGGGDEGGLKMGGGANVVALPTGARAKADASILSPVSAAKDRGSLASRAPALGGPAGGEENAGLAGTGGASPIAVGKGSLAPAAAGPVPVKEGKKLDSAQIANPLADAMKSPAKENPVFTPVLPRRAAPKAQKPMFLITGPLADRKVLSRDVPPYPEWAREKGVEAAVTLQFTVTPEGDVKDNILVARTSGYPQLDELAMGSLRKWKFVPLPPDQYREEVGTITFNFSVR